MISLEAFNCGAKKGAEVDNFWPVRHPFYPFHCSCLENHSAEHIIFEPTTVTEVVKLLKTTPAKSCQLDPVSTWLLKHLASVITPTIYHLCNPSMKNGMFPAQLKQTRVYYSHYSKNPPWIRTTSALIVPSPISPTFQSSLNVLSFAVYLITHPLSTSYQPNSQLTGLSTP